MEYRKLGNSGLKVSALSFGSWVTFSNQVDAKLAQQMFGICLIMVSISLIMLKLMHMDNQRL